MIIISLISLIIINTAGVNIAYNSTFSRYNRPDYNITPGLINYQSIKDIYSREEISFKSNEETLKGYYYSIDNSKALIIMSHGLKDGADSLLSSTIYFLNNGYNVFTYDNTGCFDSTGKANGFSQSLVDLKNALFFLNNNDKFNKQRFLLFGYSWGAYATASIFNFDVENIYGSVSISGYNDAKNLFFNKGKTYVGILAYLGKNLIENIQYKKFDKIVNYTAVNGINNTTTPVFVIHGKEDNEIKYNTDSIISLKDNIINSNVIFSLENNKDHISILYSKESYEYQNIVNKQLKSIKKYDKKTVFLKTVDNYKYSEIDNSLYERINNFYNDCIK